jgi:hypothetical protein
VRRGEAGVAAAICAQAARRQARFEDLDFLLENGEDLLRAVIRAGWPSLAAAEAALRRAHHPAWGRISRELKKQRTRTRKDHAA